MTPGPTKRPRLPWVRHDEEHGYSSWTVQISPGQSAYVEERDASSGGATVKYYERPPGHNAVFTASVNGQHFTLDVFPTAEGAMLAAEDVLQLGAKTILARLK